MTRNELTLRLRDLRKEVKKLEYMSTYDATKEKMELPFEHVRDITDALYAAFYNEFKD